MKVVEAGMEALIRISMLVFPWWKATSYTLPNTHKNLSLSGESSCLLFWLLTMGWVHLGFDDGHKRWEGKYWMGKEKR